MTTYICESHNRLLKIVQKAAGCLAAYSPRPAGGAEKIYVGMCGGHRHGTRFEILVARTVFGRSLLPAVLPAFHTLLLTRREYTRENNIRDSVV